MFPILVGPKKTYTREGNSDFASGFTQSERFFVPGVPGFALHLGFCFSKAISKTKLQELAPQ